VLQAIYAAFSAGWDAMDGDAGGELSEDAIWLGRTLVQLMPQQTEAMSLLALMLHCHARRAARRRGNAFVPLAAQDTALWDDGLIAEADGLLVMASRGEGFGRFQCEAAIQSVHVQRPITGAVNLGALRTLYDLLVEQTGSIGARIGQAVVMAEAGEPDAALAALAALPAQVARHQPFWVARAHVARLAGDRAAAEGDLARALALTGDPAVRAHLEGVLRAVEDGR
jgi:RNA polymerase sigma-70 factor (ECF subfamily)